MNKLISQQDIERLGKKEKNKFSNLTLLVGELWNRQIKEKILFLYKLNNKPIRHGTLDQALLKFSKNKNSKPGVVNGELKDYDSDFDMNSLDADDIRMLNEVTKEKNKLWRKGANPFDITPMVSGRSFQSGLDSNLSKYKKRADLNVKQLDAAAAIKTGLAAKHRVLSGLSTSQGSIPKTLGKKRRSKLGSIGSETLKNMISRQELK
jgi:hypothetical protein